MFWSTLPPFLYSSFFPSLYFSFSPSVLLFSAKILSITFSDRLSSPIPRTCSYHTNCFLFVTCYSFPPICSSMVLFSYLFQIRRSRSSSQDISVLLFRCSYVLHTFTDSDSYNNTVVTHSCIHIFPCSKISHQEFLVLFTLGLSLCYPPLLCCNLIWGVCNLFSSRFSVS